MSAPATTPVGPATLITVKVTYEDHTRRFRIPLKDLGAGSLPQTLRQLLGIPADKNVIFERYSDSAGSYVYLDSNNPAVFKQLYRAAKAKLKLRIKATVDNSATQPTVEAAVEQQSPPRYSYLDTVLSSPITASQAEANASATTSSTALPESAERTTLPKIEKNAWSSTEMSEQKSASDRDFVLGPDNPGVPVLSHTSIAGVFCIDCNNCNRPIANEHYHCTICAGGDYDLCPQCVDSGVNCLGEDHWLVRRLVKDGVITNSTTKTLASHKIKAQVEDSKPEPVQESSSEPAKKTVANPERICNNCLQEFDEGKMVSCADCEDFDLCITCVLGHKHGHHPAHTFVLLGEHDPGLKNLILTRCKPGRGYHHAAICDGCDSSITGVRHKCLTCPDWDYCSECHLSASRTHPGHRFAPLYTAISEPLQSYNVHYGVFCDGPLCKDKPRPRFIAGVRYKCTVCHDADFCAKCEVHPSNMHNRTHPMVMFKTPVRSVSVSMVHENAFSKSTNVLGDQRSQRSASTQASAPTETEFSVDAAKKPLETATIEEAEPVQGSSVKENLAAPEQVPKVGTEYQAVFIEETILDKTVMPPNRVFQQTWTVHNPGPLTWPAGSSVRFVGGDNMYNADTKHPSSIESVKAAMESNKLSEPLEKGHSAKFTVTMKTPKRLGTVISYWRLKLPDGTPFGHRLWCEVEVKDDIVVQETPAEEAKVKEEVAQVPATDHSDVSRSHMVFPKLDKESPAASTHETFSVPPIASAPSVSNPSEHDVLDDVASLTLNDAYTDTGFLTDEEYDILDASDQEFMDANSTRN
ncbi:hypothetical protein BJX61DRAFT_367196 [Aspergillus egyptiacus]|nr:hypothetical protein BJX61DRAFT_367196 [Aspergillus egyptiacus]